ncbi:imidazole glycerol phosphate synthase subunit HisH [Clostridium cellulovorans]|uniref:Imidazole glycerol phosphate synthase subunit HisH n=1 Tax=Clostridium cellulovorans (strain ATCC 35296 / DSM 3052 / OCM 3 / 743B) TaxID=573061 RepID=D9SL16_CLOC7|nr:imidazole glycerol phosphate synthase subunit HisH [Clostridium cellulovorans]ADL53588.1 imidazole glycerol phosphate synthase, glutamine amidotransferase subunit [Clostridium cellulovorans 743B]
MIAIIDYGMGNLKSVWKSLNYLNIPSVITDDPKVIKEAGGIIIPGVGAFPDAMKNIREAGLETVIKEEAKAGKPILGVCLGMQLLFETGEEMVRTEGLGLLKGTVKKIEEEVKVPHMGWNNLKFDVDSPLLKGVKEGSYAYYVHSYYASIEEEGILNAYSEYGRQIPGLVSKGNVFGAQFHPEKSGESGMQILKNFGELVK